MLRLSISSLMVYGLVGLSAFASESPANLVARGSAVEPNARIAGGQVASSSDFGFIAYIQGYIPEVGGSSCTGSLIGPNVVLTAGHCIYQDDIRYTASQFQVGLTHKRPEPGTLYQGLSVSKVITHPNFNLKTLSNDIALLILEDTVSSSQATPGKIYTGDITTSTKLVAAGFGITIPDNMTSVPTQLMEVSLTAGSNAYCRSNWGSFNSKYLICTNGASGKDTCQGDSGGPLATMVGNTLAIAGVTSYGPVSASNPEGLCAQKGSTGFYGRVGAYVDWIARAANLDANSITIGGGSSDSDDDSSSSGRGSGSSGNTSDDEDNTDSDGDSLTSGSISNGVHTSATSNGGSKASSSSDSHDHSGSSALGAGKALSFAAMGSAIVAMAVFV
ncbi:hypothetical protein GGI25_003033 [Coemansia spiralis]|uniref:Peptidase S1 domain-containing protein n=2 Tax=Coemansia TaxID=4863 RepID=A0A9W8KYT1_9FUNG|nr:trypsin-like cysteine/serine peptidase domain-containing protein [Coemansia spiralis]KAJ1992141.1 hypothetical protein EDC05_002970 [Coemansia umbellata]KAJ2622039.1 hypothetical protein GGI26_003615 [Coemansia sp. RSA 1358]KAJ2677643.1 hypothetical protein GGI25_003033 [Coemansia spiralis]